MKPWQCPDCGTWMAWWKSSHQCPKGTPRVLKAMASEIPPHRSVEILIDRFMQNPSNPPHQIQLFGYVYLLTTGES